MPLFPKVLALLGQPELRRVMLTLAWGAAGGAVFFLFRLPLAWMMGAMVITTILSMSGKRLYVPSGLRTGMVMILGVLLGSTFTPHILEHAGRWLITLSGLAVYLALATGVLYLYFHRVLKFDRVTSYFSATPGGLNEMVIVGGALGGDERTIALVHGARVLLVVLIIPFWFRFTEGIVASVATRGISLLHMRLLDLLILTACGAVGAGAGYLLRLPAYRIVGPMLASAAIHVTGITRALPPYELVFLAQVVVGSAVGARFAGVPLEHVFRTITASVGSTAVLLLFTVAAAFVLAPLAHMPRAPIVLAFSPGGLAEMSVIALSLGIETAFVATHHVARIAMIVIGAPIVFRARQQLRATKRANPEDSA